jgi:hypothetical protein
MENTESVNDSHMIRIKHSQASNETVTYFSSGDATQVIKSGSSTHGNEICTQHRKSDKRMHRYEDNKRMDLKENRYGRGTRFNWLRLGHSTGLK